MKNGDAPMVEKEELPNGWATARLDEIAALNPRHSRDLDGKQAVTFVPMPAVSETGPLLDTSQERALESVRTGYTHFAEGDVLFAKITPCMENGKGAVATGLRNGLGCGTTELHIVRPHAGIYPHYLYRFLAQRSVRRAAKENFTGSAGQARVPMSFMEELEVPLPPTNEQRRIVAKLETLLGKVDTCQQRLAKIPRLLKRFRLSVLAAACSGRLTADWREENPASSSTLREEVEELPDLPETWTCRRAADVVETGTVVTYGIVLPGPNQATGVPYIRGQDIDDSGRILVDQLWKTTPAIASKHARSELREGDVLLCVIRHLRVAIVPAGIDGANLTQGTVRLRPSAEILGPYLAHHLASPQTQAWMKRQYVGMAMPRINVEHARDIPIALPPVAEQKEIVRRVEQLFVFSRQIEARYAKGQAHVDKLTQALLAKAFRGELVPQDPNDEPAPALLARVRSSVTGETKLKRRKATA